MSRQSNPLVIQFKKAISHKEYQLGKNLLQKYAKDIGLDLSFQNFENELEELSLQYGPPHGALILIYANRESPVGCFALRLFQQDICELKRMFLDKTFRGRGIGRQMMEKALEQAKALGYSKIRLDSLQNMKAAIALYQEFGFREVEPYRFNPLDGAVYFEKEL